MARAQAALQWRLSNLRSAAGLTLVPCFGVRRLDAAFLSIRAAKGEEGL